MRYLEIVDLDGDKMIVKPAPRDTVRVFNTSRDEDKGYMVDLDREAARLLMEYLQEFLGEEVPTKPASNVRLRFASFEDLDSDEDEMVANGRVVVLATDADPAEMVEDELVYGMVTEGGVIDLSDGDALWGLDDYYVVRSSTLADAAAALAKLRKD
jgi:hypothetical protein